MTYTGIHCVRQFCFRRRIGYLASHSMVICLAILAFQCSAAEWRLIEGAQTHPDYNGTGPKKSDVILSSRYKRPEAIAAIKAFGVTRVEWVYSTDAQFIKDIKAAAGWFGGTINSIPTDLPDAGRAKDFDGNTIAPEKLKAWNGRWITTTNPETERFLQNQVRRYIELGVNSIQVDDPLLQLYSAQMWGGDFNPSTLAGFSEFLRGYPDKGVIASSGLANMTGDYRSWLKTKFGIKDAVDYQGRAASLPSTVVWNKYIQKTVAEHYSSLREFLKTFKGDRIPLSMNLTYLDEPDEKNKQFFLAPYADYALAETAIKSTEDIIARAATIRSLGLGFVSSILPRSTNKNRLAVATLYALGAQPLVPWDIFTGTDSKGQSVRLFGTAEEYGDLYSFVRKNPILFDGHESTSVVGVVVPVDKYDTSKTEAIVNRLIRRQIPFGYILTGGEQRYKVDSSKAQHFKVIFTVNADEDYSRQDLAALRSLPTKKIRADQVTDDMLNDLAPFVLSKEERTLRLYPRASGAAPKGLLIHVVDESKSDVQTSVDDCNQQISMKRSFLGGQTVGNIRWISDSARKEVQLTQTQDLVKMTWKSCALWGTLVVELDR